MTLWQFFLILAAILSVGVKVQAGRTAGMSAHDPLAELVLLLILAIGTYTAGLILLCLELT
jgi:hypothetical protein